MKKILFLLTAYSFVFQVFAEEPADTLDVIDYKENTEVCDVVRNWQASGRETSLPKPNEKKRMKVSTNILGRKKLPNLGLYVYSVDISNDGVDDLIAIDWWGMTQWSWYLGIYVYLSDGNIEWSPQVLADYFYDKKLLVRHKEGKPPLIPIEFSLKLEDGILLEKNFTGFHTLEFIRLNNVNYLVAISELGETEILVFHVIGNTNNVDVVCRVTEAQDVN